MSWLVVARKDFRDAGRSRLLWGLTALFALLVGGLAYAYAEFLSQSETISSLGFVVFLQGTAALFVSIVALLVAYKSIAGERESGTISFLLGLPHRRRDVVIGKVVGRGAVMAAALLVGFVVAALVLVGLGGTFDPVQYALFTLLSVLYAVAFVGIAVALSSITGSSGRAAAAAIGFWLLNQSWGILATAVLFVASGLSVPSPPLPDWYHALSGLGPNAAYSNAMGYFLPPEFSEQVTSQFGGLPEWYGVVVLVGWLVVPLALGVVRFQRLDL